MAGELWTIENTVLLSSNLTAGCREDCGQSLGENIDSQINHYLKHGYHILHVGQETVTKMNRPLSGFRF
jgi:hypothetical protein